MTPADPPPAIREADANDLRNERAYHEAGHAIAAHRQGRNVLGLTIEVDGSFDPEVFEAYTHVEWDEEGALADVSETLRLGTIVALAGALGESWIGRERPIFDQGPLGHAMWAAAYARMVAEQTGGEPEEIFNTLVAEAERLLTDDPWWDRYIDVANALADNGRMSREDFIAIVGE